MSLDAPKPREIALRELISTHGSHDLLISLRHSEFSEWLTDNSIIRDGIILLIVRGAEGIITIDSKEYRLPSNCMAILPENHIISNIEPLLAACEGFIAISTDYLLDMPSPIDTSLLHYARYLSIIELSNDKLSDLYSYYRFIDKESSEESRYQREIIHSIFYALMLEIVAEYECLLQPNSEQHIIADNLSDRFFRLLMLHYKEQHTIKFYAERLGLTPKYLAAAIKRATCRPIIEWIHEAILIEAKLLLRTTTLTIQQIADQLNFSSPSAFIQFYKRHTGTTPKRGKRLNK